jgi:hypothetical protein
MSDPAQPREPLPPGYDPRMKTAKALGFSLVFAVPAQMPLAAWLSAHAAWPNAMCWYPLVFLFVLLPAFDYLLGHDPVNVPPIWRRVIDPRVPRRA